MPTLISESITESFIIKTSLFHLINKYKKFLNSDLNEGWIGPLESIGYCRAVKDVIKDLEKIHNA